MKNEKPGLKNEDYWVYLLTLTLFNIYVLKKKYIKKKLEIIFHLLEVCITLENVLFLLFSFDDMFKMQWVGHRLCSL